MEFSDRGAEVAGGPNLFKNPLLLIIGGLIVLGAIGVLVLLLFVFGVLPPGRNSAATTAQATATRVVAAQVVATATPTVLAQDTPTEAPTSTPVVAQTPTLMPSAAAPAATASAPKPAAPAVQAKASANPFPGVYVTRMQVNPAWPRKNDPITFNIAFSNTSGQPQRYGVCVEAFRPGDKKAFGMTYCPRQIIPPGSSQLVSGEWTVTGIHECIPVRARPVVKVEGNRYIPFQQTTGSDLWMDLKVCP